MSASEPQPPASPTSMSNEELTANLLALKDSHDQLAKSLGEILSAIRQAQSQPSPNAPQPPSSGPPPGAGQPQVDSAMAAQILGMMRDLAAPRQTDPLTELARQAMTSDLQSRLGRRGLEDVILNSVYKAISEKIGGQAGEVVSAVFE